jgi:tubulin---tyrosine ligase
MNRGRGIEIFHNKEDILKFVSEKPMFSKWVVQKYIEQPLLYRGRKFDFRVWASVNHMGEVFFYKKGYVRLSSEEYDLSNQNNYVHLTNNCLQQHGDKYGIHEEGNTIGYEALQAYLDEDFPDLGISVEKHFIPRIKDLILDTLFSIRDDLKNSKRKSSFEFFGYDFLVDEDFRVSN